MTDYDWLSPKAIEVATNGIRAEAKKWYQLADEMAVIARTMESLTLQPSAFAVIDLVGAATTKDQHDAYAVTQDWLSQLFKEATQRFNEMGDALRRCADEYDRTDGRSAASFDQIARARRAVHR